MTTSALLRALAAPLVLWATGCASAPEAKAPKDQPQTPEAMVEAWLAVAEPAPEHALLSPFVGSFDAVVRMWMDPKAEPTESRGTMTNRWIFGGRYLEQRYQGEFAGQPFEGLGYWGFDVAAGEYLGTWFDSMSTTMSFSRGPASADGRVFVLHAQHSNPVTGLPQKVREVITVEGPNRHRMEVFEQRGSERVKTMEILYTRRNI